jgi:acyl-CoA thioesterase-1
MQIGWGKRRLSRMTVIILCVLTGLVLFAAFEYAWVKWNGTPIPEPDTPRALQTIGAGPERTYVVMGDSTAVSQGGEYKQGYAVQTAEHQAQTYTLQWKNVAVAGARAADVATKQLPQAKELMPDVVLIGVGANDVTHLTNIGAVRQSLTHTIQELRKSNSNVEIILTGSPDMGSVPRLPQPLRWIAGNRTKDINKMIVELSKEENVRFAPIAEKTGKLFRQHPELFAADNFHPNTEGYKTWTPVIVEALPE